MNVVEQDETATAVDGTSQKMSSMSAKAAAKALGVDAIVFSSLPLFVFFGVQAEPPLAWDHGEGECRDVIILFNRYGRATGLIVADVVHARKTATGCVYTSSHIVRLADAVAVLKSYGRPKSVPSSAHLHSPLIPKKVGRLLHAPIL